MRHSHPCRARQVRFGVLRQSTASHETLRSKDANENCPACSASGKVAEQVGAELLGKRPVPGTSFSLIINSVFLTFEVVLSQNALAIFRSRYR